MKKCPKCNREYETTNTLCPVDGTVLERSTDELLGQTLAGKYHIDEYINAGGMASVYRATHVLMDKRVAVKILHANLAADDTVVSRFTREAKAASRITHPHVLNVTDFGESDNGVVFLVMEYLDGRTLKQVINEESPLALTRISEITRQVCDALDAAHAEGVVHRDLKSDNIMLGEVGTFHDWVKVLDFGIAKIQEPLGTPDANLTAPNIVIGTPHYMSPEQCAQSAAIDYRTDIYSFGIILFEMLTGHVPFTGDSATAVMMQHLQNAVPPVLNERPELPPAIGKIIERALAKQPEDRFESAGKLAEAFAVTVAEIVETERDDAQAAVIGAGVAASVNNEPATPTDANLLPRTTAQINDDDDATLLQQPAPVEPIVTPAEKVAAAYANAAASEQAVRATSGVPWRFIVPVSLIILVAVGLYATGNLPSGGNANTTSPATTAPLKADPQSQPVTPSTATASGESERDINVRPVAPPTPESSTSGETSTTSNANAVEESPAIEDTLNTEGRDTNTNGEATIIRNQNANNDDEAAVEPTSTPANRNANPNTDTPRTVPSVPVITTPRPTPSPSASPRPTPRLSATITSEPKPTPEPR